MKSSKQFQTSWVTVWVASPDTHSERKLDLDTTIAQLKAKLEPITGIGYSSQRLDLLRADEGELVRSLEGDDDKTLKDFGVVDWMCIKVSNTDPVPAFAAGVFSDTSSAPKFELTDEEYGQRRDTVQAYLRNQRLGPKYGTPSEPLSPKPKADESIPAGTEVGARCELESAGRGTVRFVGKTSFGEGVWVGVDLDEPAGKNDGSVKGERYFTAKGASYGLFVRPAKVSVGDFPERDLMDDSDEEEI